MGVPIPHRIEAILLIVSCVKDIMFYEGAADTMTEIGGLSISFGTGMAGNPLLAGLSFGFMVTGGIACGMAILAHVMSIITVWNLGNMLGVLGTDDDPSERPTVGI